jgi:hypothetical protein
MLETREVKKLMARLEKSSLWGLDKEKLLNENKSSNSIRIKNQ